MSAPTPVQVADWRKKLHAHTMRDGKCPVCKKPHRCRPWADAFADLLAHGELPETTPARTTGGTPTAASTKEEAP
ncbi:hypothetical protein GA0070620_6536 [Micromonospora krabiensis]|uniref:Uncharacterized protein n=1 Tax=Micromonospora krabiensis TaxID=307121 RepID=A0A1C3NEF7_9ACTN|nr:hypothetical protein GA0070620_6536 [Micromonospora krabiensis]